MKKLTKRQGNAEFDLLLHIAKTGSCTVRQAYDTFGEQRGYVRTTVQQMMDRLRSKGMLVREGHSSGFIYKATRTADEIQRAEVEDFVQSTLKGSAAPLVAYFADTDGMSEEDLEEIRRILDAKLGGGS